MTDTIPCPYCGTAMEADWVHNGVANVQCGPFHCPGCGASEIGPEQSDPGFSATDEELRTGYYRDRVSPLANTFLGIPVPHPDAERLHGMGLLDADRGR